MITSPHEHSGGRRGDPGEYVRRMVELDHVHCFVDPAGDRAARGWRLDDGIELALL
jgi:hypothetical protein